MSGFLTSGVNATGAAPNLSELHVIEIAVYDRKRMDRL
jgi:hypothetical protein